ncbi:5'-methylthioadenosine phosphorylase [Stemphylium lycopersici]|uniref:5'-methylthioadenosine phosphorylase n=1 Tax=Stemphylium lycopersici TaxID=183478 RepID=A0A364NAL3_STELY|nr:5'-methylthioadenosine phosphorylase [Stemphylium lycopersici]
MRSSLQQLQDRTQCSRLLLEEAAAERSKTQVIVKEYDDRQAERRRLHEIYGPYVSSVEVQSCEDQIREEQECESARAKLKSDEDLAACKQISQRMFETLPRELRDLIYCGLSADIYIPEQDKDITEMDGVEFSQKLRDAGDAEKSTPLHRRFSFFRRHCFQASYMGVEFVKELINAYFRLTPFRLRVEELYSRHGHQEFFMVDGFNLGCPLGELLARVEISVTSLHSNLGEMLQPLMAIKNPDCVIEIAAPRSVTRCNTYDLEDRPATSQELLHALALNLRRMRLRGFCVRVRHDGLVIYTANEKPKEPRDRTSMLRGSEAKAAELEKV